MRRIDDRGPRADQAVRRANRSRRPHLHRPAGRRHGFPRAERRRQVDDDAHDRRPRRPDNGDATVNGRRYREHRRPSREVGVLLEARAIHTGRTAREPPAGAGGDDGDRPRSGSTRSSTWSDSSEVADKRVGSFSLGMGQRLGIASALLGDPATVMLDEPVNGLDPEGILWVRNLLKGLAAEGRTVFVSSHLMGEMALTADQLIVIGRGRLIRDESTEDFIASASAQSVRVRSPQAEAAAQPSSSGPGSPSRVRGRRTGRLRSASPTTSVAGPLRRG